MTEHNEDNELPDAELAEKVLGTETYSGNVYSPSKARELKEKDRNNQLEGKYVPSAREMEAWIAEKNEESRQKEKEKSWHSHTDYIGFISPTVNQVVQTGALVTHAAFYHMNGVGDLETHDAYNAAYRRPDFTIEYDVDYEAGEVTLTVERTD